MTSPRHLRTPEF